MDKSKFLSKVIGLYFIIVSLAVFFNRGQFILYVQDLIKEPALMFVSGFFTLILGLLMVVGHNVWQWNWRLLITLVGWIVLLKGASIIFYPHFIDQVTVLYIHNAQFAYAAAGFNFILGVLFCYFGFRRR